jgi:hypothetical protein
VDDKEFLGFKNKDFEGLVNKEDYEEYVKNFKFDCFQDGKF